MTRARRWIAIVTCGLVFVGLAAWALRRTATVQVARAQVTTGPIVCQVIAVRVGLADDGWTELLSGPIHPGDSLVTSARLTRGLRN
jgi:hypothetical protein